jgi:hypothetical protein
MDVDEINALLESLAWRVRDGNDSEEFQAVHKAMLDQAETIRELRNQLHRIREIAKT